MRRDNGEGRQREGRGRMKKSATVSFSSFSTSRGGLSLVDNLRTPWRSWRITDRRKTVWHFSEHCLLPETVSQAERLDRTKQSRRWCETIVLPRPPQSTLRQRRGFRHLSGAPYTEPPSPSPSYSATSKAQIASIFEFHISDYPPPPPIRLACR